MDNREAMGSWLSGPRAAAEDMGVEFGYRGQRLGLPEKGPGSVAPVGRRLAAVFIDWILCVLIAYGLIAHRNYSASTPWALVLFGALSLISLSLVGSTPGKRLLGLRVIGLDGGRLTPLATLIRTVLLLLVIPAVVWDRDTRGLHDKAAKAVQVRI